MRLTATSIRGLACPAGKTEYTYFDDDLPGFGLRTRPGGSSSWLFQYAVAGRTRKMFLGGPSVVDPGQARDAARDLAAQVRLGRDPAREKSENRAKAKDTFVGLLPRFLERQRERARRAATPTSNAT